ncbi:hypothetical protein COEREDRAFT_100017 [Coemansia reversa NRRL 1564]|uniref:Uncharacterized protein n=1 Tax=Coemansia reversa (strain ATCC 12441 / NRRL 1564) TaxID=763665 RepID=A0A2G5B0S2_COERN|nr:hypothetical protein COEREDRAFT_100017 [Coemansia reversa NRRL 1564]|eukprot:PIA12609.1 hypothetical protein COEREDRAFT_100017 [Coemansia reversa NRRL 1564]
MCNYVFVPTPQQRARGVEPKKCQYKPKQEWCGYHNPNRKNNKLEPNISPKKKNINPLILTASDKKSDNDDVRELQDATDITKNMSIDKEEQEPENKSKQLSFSFDVGEGSDRKRGTSSMNTKNIGNDAIFTFDQPLSKQDVIIQEINKIKTLFMPTKDTKISKKGNKYERITDHDLDLFFFEDMFEQVIGNIDDSFSVIKNKLSNTEKEQGKILNEIKNMFSAVQISEGNLQKTSMDLFAKQKDMFDEVKDMLSAQQKALSLQCKDMFCEAKHSILCEAKDMLDSTKKEILLETKMMIKEEIKETKFDTSSFDPSDFSVEKTGRKLSEARITGIPRTKSFTEIKQIKNNEINRTRSKSMSISIKSLLSDQTYVQKIYDSSLKNSKNDRF